ncbi:MAG: hypothetical protein E6I62_09880 [Chloroflexi bacterium]|nr:MAG: hypothetical protein E6I62_09880 [Chloroflexota bacterium]
MSEIANNRVSARGHAGVLNGTWIGLREITGHAYLIARLTRAELLRDGAGLLLGEAWWVADPLLQMLIYSLVVGVIFARSLPDYPLFVLSALLAWKALASTISSGCTAITGNERIVRQVAFPRLVLPVAVMFSEFARFVIGMGVLVLRRRRVRLADAVRDCGSCRDRLRPRPREPCATYSAHRLLPVAGSVWPAAARRPSP